jgi:type VI secretion system protein VasJ
MLSAAQARAQNWLAPVRESEPAGTDARYEAAYAPFRAELDKLESPTGASPSWDTVFSTSDTVLRTLSKDLLVACGLTVALYRREGLHGLGVGLVTLKGLLETYGSTVHPARPKARANALTWLLSQTVDALSVGTGNRAEDVLLAKHAYHAFQEAARTVLGDDLPSLTPLRDALERLALSLPAGAAAEPRPTPPTLPEAEPNVPLPPLVEAAAPTTEPEPVAEPQVADAPGIPPRVMDLLQPVFPHAPSGEDAKYDDRTLAIRTELEKLEGLAGQSPDWKRIADVAASVLTNKSKDLYCGTALACAWWELDGLTGLEAGTALLAELMERFQDTLWPPKARQRARISLCEWYEQRMTAGLSGYAPRLADLPALVAARSNLDRLQHAGRDVLGDDAPLYRSLRDALTRISLQLEEERSASARAKTEAQAAPPRTPAAAASPPGSLQHKVAEATPASSPVPAAAPGPVTAFEAPQVAAFSGSTEDVTAFLASTGAALAQAGRALCGTGAASPLACRLVRLGLWLHIDQPPPHGPSGKTAIPPPDARLRESLQKMKTHGSWAGLLEHAEGCLSTARFWLDLHLYIDCAYGGLGETFRTQRAVCASEARMFFGRMPALQGLTFADGTPLASSETQAWLNAGADSQHVATSAASDPSSGQLSKATRTALSAKSGDLTAALAAADAERQQLSSGHSRFRLQLEVALALSAGEHWALAMPAFESLAEIDRRMELHSWDPSLALEFLSGYARATRAHGRTIGVVHPRLSELCARVANISLAGLAQVLA